MGSKAAEIHFVCPLENKNDVHTTIIEQERQVARGNKTVYSEAHFLHLKFVKTRSFRKSVANSIIFGRIMITKEITFINYIKFYNLQPPCQNYLRRSGTSGGPFAFPHKRNSEKKPVAISGFQAALPQLLEFEYQSRIYRHPSLKVNFSRIYILSSFLNQYRLFLDA